MNALRVAALALALSLSAQPSETPRFGDAAGALAWARAEAKAMPSPRSAPAPSLSKAQLENPWRRATTPSPRSPESIGDYSAGCLRGAQAIELHGAGFEVMRPSRNRFYGHPRVLAFIRTLGLSAPGAGLGTLIIGDIGQPRGGPTLSGHASHQNGLDIDVWYKQVPAGTQLSQRDRETMSASQVVVPDFERLNASWNPKILELLRLAASDAEVERIFVNPVVKRAVCKAHAGAPWLSKLRPWWAHDDHFHARLRCPSGDRQCKNQEAAPPGDGCGAELAGWFTPEKKAEARRLRTEPAPPPKMPILPPVCSQVLVE